VNRWAKIQAALDAAAHAPRAATSLIIQKFLR